MKYLLILLLACLATIEFFHHRSQLQAGGAMPYAAPHAKSEGAADKPRQPLHNH
jgi:hypothetical protein